MAGTVTGATPQAELVHQRVAGQVEIRLVVVLGELRVAAFHTDPVPFAHDTPLSLGRMALANRCVDRATLRIMDQRSRERPR